MLGLHTKPRAQHWQAMYALSTMHNQLPWTPMLLRDAAARLKAQHVQAGSCMHVQPDAAAVLLKAAQAT